MTTVKDVVRAFEAHSQSALPSPSRSSSAQSPSGAPRASIAPLLPPPTPARFIHPSSRPRTITKPQTGEATGISAQTETINAPTPKSVLQPNNEGPDAPNLQSSEPVS